MCSSSELVIYASLAMKHLNPLEKNIARSRNEQKHALRKSSGGLPAAKPSQVSRTGALQALLS